jgi:hypothetical protein
MQQGTAMAKSKKSDLEKAAKDKGLKGLKGEKLGKDKKDKKKDKSSEARAPKKTSVAAVEPKPEKKAAKSKAVVFTTTDISLRAYFIAERRQAMGWPGDSTSDWAEAERQLKAESAKKSKL